MKVYILTLPFSEGVEVYGVYSSKALALSAIPYAENRLGEEDIVEAELDPPNTGPLYKQYCYYGVVPSNGREFCGTHWMQEGSNSVKTGTTTDGDWVCAEAESLEAAKEMVLSYLSKK